MKNKKIRVRFAPSPTGELHIGGARTALFNFLFAKHNNGKIILRIEDTDLKRYVLGSVERLIENLNWLGIEFDEYPKKQNNEKTKEQWNSVGKFGPYIQSQRLGIYQEYAEKLVEHGNAYYCFCTEKRLKKMREEQSKKKQAPMYDRRCLGLTSEEKQKNLESKKPYVIRLKVPYSGVTSFNDLIRGHIEISNETIDDQILMKSDGMPTYHLANVIDDHLMEISHVIRAEEWLPSTPKHIILYNYLKWDIPKFAHIPLVLAKDKSKLSKRHGAVSVEEFKKLGYLPKALVNYIALLGWNPKSDKEFFDKNKLIKEFEIKNINKAGAIFDIEKLNYFNAHYLKQKSVDELYKLIIQNAKIKVQNDIEKLKIKKIIAVVKDRIAKLLDFNSFAKMFLEEPKYLPELLIFRKSTKDSTLKGLKLTAYGLRHMTPSEWESIDKINKKLKAIVLDGQFSNGDVFWPVRVALSGQENSPSPGELLWVLGKDESLKRINKSLATLKEMP